MAKHILFPPIGKEKFPIEAKKEISDKKTTQSSSFVSLSQKLLTILNVYGNGKKNSR